jgi:hypothetical protein
MANRENFEYIGPMQASALLTLSRDLLPLAAIAAAWIAYALLCKRYLRGFLRARLF